VTRWWRRPYSTVCSIFPRKDHIVNIQGNSYPLQEYPGLSLPQEGSTVKRRGRPRKPTDT